MAKPSLVAADDDPQVLPAVTNDLKRRYRDRDRVLGAGGVPITDARERSDVEGALSDSLVAHEVPDPWATAETLVDAGLSVAAVARVTDGLPEGARTPALEWLAADPDTPPVAGDPAELDHVRTNHLDNAIGAMGSAAQADDVP